MSNFNLFKNLSEHTTNIIKTTESLPMIKSDNECQHSKIIYDNGVTLCNDCGMELDINTNSRESIFFSVARETKLVSDPSRCYIRKHKNKSIYQDVQHLNISDHIKDVANDIYTQCSGEKVKRGCNRRGIVFASIFHAYKLDKNPQSCESLIATLDIERKDALKGLKFINDNAPSNASLRTTYITPEHLIIEFVSKFKATKDQQNEIIQLYRKIKGRSSMLNRSRPQSVSSGIIYYWLLVADRNITLKEFIDKVGLSELTVINKAKEISRILNTPHVL